MSMFHEGPLSEGYGLVVTAVISQPPAVVPTLPRVKNSVVSPSRTGLSDPPDACTRATTTSVCGSGAKWTRAERKSSRRTARSPRRVHTRGVANRAAARQNRRLPTRSQNSLTVRTASRRCAPSETPCSAAAGGLPPAPAAADGAVAAAVSRPDRRQGGDEHDDHGETERDNGAAANVI